MREEIERALGMPVAVADKQAAVSASGMLVSHYAPNANLRLNTMPRDGEAFLAFGAVPDFAEPMRNLSVSGDLHEAARNLFAMLHEFDAAGKAMIAVAPIPDTGLGEAINDRLQRRGVGWIAESPPTPPSRGG